MTKGRTIRITQAKDWLAVADSDRLIQAFDISIYDIDLMHINSTNALQTRLEIKTEQSLIYKSHRCEFHFTTLHDFYVWSAG